MALTSEPDSVEALKEAKGELHLLDSFHEFIPLFLIGRVGPGSERPHFTSLEGSECRKPGRLEWSAASLVGPDSVRFPQWSDAGGERI